MAGDLRSTWQEVIRKYRERAGVHRPALLAACPPCQGMSSAKHDRGLASDPTAGSKDRRNLLVEVIAKVAAALEPKIVVVENVQEFLIRQIYHPRTNEPISAARYLAAELMPKYWPFAIVADLSDYGVPQTRKRAFLTFVRRDLAGLRKLPTENRAPFPRPTHGIGLSGEHKVTLRAALKGFELPSLDASTAERAKGNGNHPMHFVPVWDAKRYAMVRAIAPGSGGSAWDNKECAVCGQVDVERDESTCPKCSGPLLRPVLQKADGSYRLITGFRTSSYRRMHPDRPAPTVTTASGHLGSNFTIHPFENRLLSPLECARLQTFSDSFKWGDALEKWGATNVRDMIGEAVPPRFTEMHGQVLVELLSGRRSTVVPISLNDSRCEKALNRLQPPEQPLGVGVRAQMEFMPTSL